MDGKKQIPGTNPDWGVNLPDGYDNSLVDDSGKNRDDGYNFDERDDDNDNNEGNSFETLSHDRELAEYAKNQIIYTGLFINPDDLYGKFPPALNHRIRDPHVTVAYRPDETGMFLDALGSGAKITAVGYGNDGMNEGLEVKVEANDPTIQKTLEDRTELDENGERKHVIMHITLALNTSDPNNIAEAVNTRNLEFKPLEQPVELGGTYKLFGKDGNLIESKEKIEEMKKEGYQAGEEVSPDYL